MAKGGPRKELMERELLDHAAELFARNGYGGTSMQEIANTAGVGRTTLYHYFNSKEDFLTALVEEVSLGASSKLRELRQRSDLSPAAKLDVAVRMLVTRVVQSPMRFRVLERDEDNLPTELAKRHKSAKRDALKELVTVIESGITAGQFKPIDSQIAGLTIFGMCNWTAWWFNPSGPVPTEHVIDSVTTMALGALTRAEAKAGPQEPLEIIGHINDDLAVLARVLQASGDNR